MKKIVIVGGGAAGMIAAIAAASSSDTHVFLIEKNEKLGKKIYITGKGRCNVTNAVDSDPEQFFRNIVTNKKFTYSAVYSFNSDHIIRLLEENGCPVKIERGNRVFPVSDHASDVTGALKRKLNNLGVEILLETEVKKLEIRDNQIYGVYTATRRESDYLEADCVIVATGGLSYSSTGSTGDGYKFAESAGLEVKKCVPSLVPFNCKESYCADLTGLSLKNVTLSLYGTKKKPLYTELGEMLFTHFGISGPLVLSASSYLPADRDFEKDNYRVVIDLKPALDETKLDERLLKDLAENNGKQFKNAVHAWLPAKLLSVVIDQSGIDVDKKTDVITKEERKAFIHTLKNLELHIESTRTFAEAIITKGGVDIREINPGTMESKKVKGLYFAGEVLDLDALTGGHNLQIAWSTGYLAGSEAGMN